MAMEFIPGAWYPIALRYMLPRSVEVTIAKLDTAKFKRLSDVTHFTVDERTVIEPPKPQLPNVPEFLRDGVKVGDLVFFNKGGCRFVISIQSKFHRHPINTILEGCNARAFSLGGWGRYKGAKDGDRQYLHIIRIERNGVTVAEGQVYND